MNNRNKKNIFPRKTIYFLVVLLGILIIGAYLIVLTDNSYLPKGEMKAISTIKPFHFLNQYGKATDESVWKNKVGISYFFFTSCKNVCPLIYAAAADIARTFEKDSNFIILGHTCDPETDSVARLAWYAQEMNITDPRWMLLTGNAKELYEAARFIYKIDDPKQAVGADFHFMHTQHIAIISNNKVLYIFDGLKAEDRKEAKRWIRSLLANASHSQHE